jgi:large subunit ribosomal protein L21
MICNNIILTQGRAFFYLIISNNMAESNKIAVIKTGGKQYKVKSGQVLKIEKIEKEAGENVKFDTLLVADTDGSAIDLGAPSLGEKVEAKVLEQGRDKKVTVVKYKNKTRYKRTIGHRQSFTKIEITSIA